MSAQLATECPDYTFLGESVKDFWIINIWISDLCKVDYSPQGGLPSSSDLLRAWIEAGQKTEEIPPFFFSCLTTWTDVSSHLLGPWTDIYTFASSGSQAFLRLALNYATGFLGFPVCRWQIVGLLSPHNHVSQLFIINLLYKGLYTYRYMPMKHRSIVDSRKNWKILLVPTWVL